MPRGRRGGRERRDPSRPLAVWSEPDFLDGKKVKALVAVLATEGCSWARASGCTMCGYASNCPPRVDKMDLESQAAIVLEKLPGHDTLKVFTSGSFFDPGEVDPEVQQLFFEKAGAIAKRITVETRPEYVDAGRLAGIKPACRLEVALGLETSSDLVLSRSINKGFTVADYAKAAGVLASSGAEVKTYLLLKPPYLTEREAIEDAVRSAEFAARHSRSISVNPVNVQSKTVVERMWRDKQYRSPWLWSLVEVLRRGKREGAWIVSQPSGAGKERGVHNCGKCDASILAALERFNETQDARVFDGLDCQCRQEWLDLIELEGLYQNSISF